MLFSFERQPVEEPSSSTASRTERTQQTTRSPTAAAARHGLGAAPEQQLVGTEGASSLEKPQPSGSQAGTLKPRGNEHSRARIGGGESSEATATAAATPTATTTTTTTTGVMSHPLTMYKKHDDDNLRRPNDGEEDNESTSLEDTAARTGDDDDGTKTHSAAQSAMKFCSFCQKYVATVVELQPTAAAFIMSVVMFLACGWISFCIIPFVWPILQVRHTSYVTRTSVSCVWLHLF